MPPIRTNKVQPLDTGILKLYKDIWKNIWIEQKTALTEDGQWVSGRKLRHLGKRNILELAEEVRIRISQCVGNNGVSRVRLSMIQAGLSRDLDGAWRVQQYRQELQQIIQAYPENYAGQEPVPPQN